MFNAYSVKIGDTLWSALYSYIESTYPNEEKAGYSKYSIDGVFEEDSQKFAVLKDSDDKYYRLNFSFSEEDGFQGETGMTEMVDYSASTQFESSEVETYITEYVKKKEEKEEENEGKKDKENKKDSEEKSEEDEKKDSEGTSEEDKKNDSEDDSKDDEEKDEKKKKKFSYNSLSEIPEYAELQTKFSELQAQVSTLNTTIEGLTAELTPLRDFKAQAERKEKEDMIARFYMLSDEDKKDVVTNIDKYSLDDIEAKLSIVCVRNKVSFSDDNSSKVPGTTFSLEDTDGDSSTPAWVKAALETAKTLD